MCLDTLDKFVSVEENSVVYKVFVVERSYGEILLSSPLYDQGCYRLNEWYEADKSQTIHCSSQYKSYTSGFHCFVNVRDADDWIRHSNRSIYKVCKVQIRDVMYCGTQELIGSKSVPVVVCGSIKILEILPNDKN